ncbi:MAG TPA: hypothetical protein VGT61_12715 [Thermomicrobiales bacterium]|jgi:hypothetical protein|nr:hypothetical protein [Thermomicrobiales bacterium]
MTLIQSHAALLLGLLPALPAVIGKLDDMSATGDRDAPAPTGREDVLEMLQQGVISTEEALDLLDGIEQAAATRTLALAVDAADEPLREDKAGSRRRPDRPPRPARSARAVRIGAERGPGQVDAGRRVLRIQVNEADGSHVNLGLPIGFIDAGLRVAERYAPGLLQGAVGDSIRRAVGSGQTGTIIEVTEADGQLVRIAVE